MEYFKSNEIKVYPCSNRGFDTQGNPLDPEARLTTEKNLSTGNFGLSNTFIKNIILNRSDNTKIDSAEFIIGGYNFNINGSFSVNDLKDKYLSIVSIDVGLVDSTNTRILSNIKSGNQLLDENDAGDYYFYGLKVTDKNNIPNGAMSIQLINVKGELNYSAYLPNLSRGSGKNSVTLHNCTAITDNQFSIGQYNKEEIDKKYVFTIGDGSEQNLHNLLEITKDASGTHSATYNIGDGKLEIQNDDTRVSIDKTNYKIENIDYAATNIGTYKVNTNTYQNTAKTCKITSKNFLLESQNVPNTRVFNYTEYPGNNHTIDIGDDGDSNGKIFTYWLIIAQNDVHVGGIALSKTDSKISTTGDISAGNCNITTKLTASEIEASNAIKVDNNIINNTGIISNNYIVGKNDHNKSLTIYYDPDDNSTIAEVASNNDLHINLKDTQSEITYSKASATAEANRAELVFNEYTNVIAKDKITATNFLATSDKRLKENIEEYVCNKSILDLPIYRYDFINGNKNQIGCLAQDLKEICPEIVDENKDGYLSIQETKLVYLLLEEVKQNKKTIEILNKKINKLEKRIKKLEK